MDGGVVMGGVVCFWVAGEIYTKPTRLWLPLIIQAPRQNVVKRRLLRAGGAAPCWPLDRPPVCARVLDKSTLGSRFFTGLCQVPVNEMVSGGFPGVFRFPQLLRP